MAEITRRDFIDPNSEEQKDQIQEVITTEKDEVDEIEVEETNDNEEASEFNQVKDFDEVVKDEKETGVVTNIGNFLGYLLKSDGLTADALNGIASALKTGTSVIPYVSDATESLDKFILGSQETKDLALKKAELQTERLDDPNVGGIEKGLIRTSRALTGVSSGLEGGIAMPFTLAARLENSDAPWSDPPAVLKDSPLGSTVFEITQIVAPTLLGGAIVNAPLGGTTLSMLAGESALETIAQDGADDLIAGRFLATRIGNLATQLGYDGEQLTIDMIEGNNFNGEALVAVVGFIQNFGINLGVDQIFKYFAGIKQSDNLLKNLDETTPQPNIKGELPTTDPVVSGNTIDVDVIPDPESLPLEVRNASKILNQSDEQTFKNLSDVNTSQPTKFQEPHDAMDVDSVVNVNKPNNGNQFINDDAFQTEIGRGIQMDTPATRTGNLIGEDGLTRADRRYFSNWKSITDEEGVKTALQELTSNLKKLKDFPADFNVAVKRANHFWSKNSHLLGQDIEAFAREFYREGLVALDARKSLNDFDGINWQRLMRENTRVADDFFIASGLLAEELGVRFAKAARQVVNLETSKIDFTTAAENLVQMVEKGDLFLIPLRRAKRQWAVAGYAQQKDILKKFGKKYAQYASEGLENVGKTPTPRDLTLIKRNDTDAGKTLRELWEGAKAGNKTDLETFKEYASYISSAPPDEVFGLTKNLSDAIQNALRINSKENIKTLRYAQMLATLGPQTAAGATNIARLIAEPLGNIVSPIFRAGRSGADMKTVMHGIGQLIGTQASINDAMFAFVRAVKNDSSINASEKYYRLAKTWKRKSAELDAARHMLLDKLNRENGSNFDKTMVHVKYWVNMSIYNPFTNFAKRFLLAQDDLATTLAGNQEATGRAFAKAWEDGVFNLGFDAKKLFKKGESSIIMGDKLEQYVKHSIDNVFEDGIRNGRIMDESVLERARNIAMMQDIPTDPKYANTLDGFFKGLESSAENNLIHNFFMPFSRLSWNFMDALGRSIFALDPTGALNIKGGTGVIERLVPRYTAILAGEFGEVAEMQLKSQIAFTRLFALSNVSLALTGNITGNFPPDGLPKNSVIVPTPWTETGYTAFPHDRIQPFSAVTSIIADLVHLHQQKVINEKQYGQAVQMVTATIGISVLDQTFLRGLQNQANYLDLKKYVNQSGTSVHFNRVGSDLIMSVPHPLNPVFWAGFGRNLFDLIQPYETVNINPDSFIDDVRARIHGRIFGGVGNPIKIDRYTGLEIPKSGSEGTNPFMGVINNLFTSLGWAGKIEEADPNNFVKGEMYKYGYNFDKPELSTWKNLQLSGEEISSFNKYMHSEGKLEQRLTDLFKSNKRFKNLVKQWEQLKNDGLLAEADVVQNQIHVMIDKVHQNAREIAYPFVINDHPELLRKWELYKQTIPR